jgi:hypothetical protein
VNPTSLPARNRKIASLGDAGKLDDAEKQVRSILEGNNRDVNERFYDGRVSMARGKIEEALHVLLPLSREEPLSPVAHHLGSALLLRTPC